MEQCFSTCGSVFPKTLDYVRTHHMFSRILNFYFFSIQIKVILAFHNLFWFLNENPFRKNQSKWQISWNKFRFRRFKIRENMWWTRYRSCGSSVRSSGSGSNSENARTGMSLKGKDNQTASEDVLKLAPQVLYIFSQHIYYLPT